MSEDKLIGWEEFQVQPSFHPQIVLEAKVQDLFQKKFLSKSQFDDLMRCIELHGDLEFRTVKVKIDS